MSDRSLFQYGITRSGTNDFWIFLILVKLHLLLETRMDMLMEKVSNSIYHIYNKLSQVMQLAEHNAEVTEIVHCYQNEI